MMLNTQEPIQNRQQYFIVRKKHFFIGLFIFFVLVVLVFRFFILHGLYIGFFQAQQASPPLSSELVTRFNHLEDKLNQSIKDINEIYLFKEKLEKSLPTTKDQKLNNGKGGSNLPLEKLALEARDYDIDTSLQKIDHSIDLINQEIPLLKKVLASAMFIKSNLPDGVPLIGTYMLSSGFGVRDDPFTFKKSFHTGVDFSAEEGSPVLAVSAGKVRKVNFNTDGSGFGNYIELSHPKDIVTLYGHLSTINVRENQIIQKGDIIGEVGSTGRSTGSHLHFEIQVAGQAVDPLSAVSPMSIKPNAVSLSALKNESKSNCAPLLLITKDENSKIYKECLSTKGANAKDLMVAKQLELSIKRSLSSYDKNALKNECTYVDSAGRLRIYPREYCGPKGSQDSLSE